MKYEKLYDICKLYTENSKETQSNKSWLNAIKTFKRKLNQKTLQKAIPEIREMYYQLEEIEKPYNDLLSKIDKEIKTCDNLMCTYTKLVKHYSNTQTKLKTTSTTTLTLGSLSGGVSKTKSSSKINNDFNPEKARELKRIADEIKIHKDKLVELESSSKEYKKKFKQLNRDIIKAARKYKDVNFDSFAYLSDSVQEFDNELRIAVSIPERLKKLDIYIVESMDDISDIEAKFTNDSDKVTESTSDEVIAVLESFDGGYITEDEKDFLLSNLLSVVVYESEKELYSYTPIKTNIEIKDYQKYLKEVYDDDELGKTDIRTYLNLIRFNNEHIGYIGLSDIEEDGKKYLGISDFLIIPKYQRHGHGSKVIKDIIRKYGNDYHEIYCWVKKTNKSAIKFYEKIAKIKREIYQDGAYYVEIYLNKNKK